MVALASHVLIVIDRYPVAVDISRFLFLVNLLGFLPVLIERKNHPDNFLDVNRPGGFNITNPVLKTIHNLMLVYVMALTFAMLFKFDVSFISESTMFNASWSAGMALFLFSNGLMYDYRLSVMHDK